MGSWFKYAKSNKQNTENSPVLLFFCYNRGNSRMAIFNKEENGIASVGEKKKLASSVEFQHKEERFMRYMSVRYKGNIFSYEWKKDCEMWEKVNNLRFHLLQQMLHRKIISYFSRLALWFRGISFFFLSRRKKELEEKEKNRHWFVKSMAEFIL